MEALELAVIGTQGKRVPKWVIFAGEDSPIDDQTHSQTFWYLGPELKY